MINVIKWIFTIILTNYLTNKRQINIPRHIPTHIPLIDIIDIKSNLNKKICDVFPFLCVISINNYEKYIICHTYLILLRFICFNVTILPPPMKLEKRLSFGIIPNYTYDLIFSGHTMTCVLSIFCVKQFLIPYTLILSILCSLSLIITKEHYTIDVIIAWIATHSIVSLYSININELLETNPQ